MEQISFKMISNNQEIINEKTAYYKKDNTINFKINNDLYSFDEEKIILIKRDKEKELVIKFQEKVILIIAKEENINLSYPMRKVSVDITEKIINLSYSLEEGETLHNTINIEF